MRMKEISEGNVHIKNELERMSVFNGTISDKFKKIDIGLHETNELFYERLQDFNPNEYGLCTTKKFNEKLSDVHKSILDKMTVYRKRLEGIEGE